jgi:hypothetical protein
MRKRRDASHKVDHHIGNHIGRGWRARASCAMPHAAQKQPAMSNDPSHIKADLDWHIIALYAQPVCTAFRSAARPVTAVLHLGRRSGLYCFQRFTAR